MSEPPSLESLLDLRQRIEYAEADIRRACSIDSDELRAEAEQELKAARAEFRALTASAPQNLEYLRGIATAATPGPWVWDVTQLYIDTEPSRTELPLFEAASANDADCEYVETMHPGTTLALIDELEAARARIAELEAKVEKDFL